MFPSPLLNPFAGHLQKEPSGEPSHGGRTCSGRSRVVGVVLRSVGEEQTSRQRSWHWAAGSDVPSLPDSLSGVFLPSGPFMIGICQQETGDLLQAFCARLEFYSRAPSK